MAERRIMQRPRDPGLSTERKLIGAVHAATRRLGIDNDERHDLQMDVIGKASLKSMSVGELGKLLDHLNRDWKGPSGHRAHIGKIRALWWSLYWLGEIHSPNDDALSAFVQRQTGISHLKFLDHRSAPAVIEALKSWCERAGVKWPSADETADLARYHPEFTATLHDRHRVLEEIAFRLKKGGIIYAGYSQYLPQALDLPVNQFSWTGRQLDEGIRLLGKKLRKTIVGDDG